MLLKIKFSPLQSFFCFFVIYFKVIDSLTLNQHVTVEKKKKKVNQIYHRKFFFHLTRSQKKCFSGYIFLEPIVFILMVLHLQIFFVHKFLRFFFEFLVMLFFFAWTFLLTFFWIFAIFYWKQYTNVFHSEILPPMGFISLPAPVFFF